MEFRKVLLHGLWKDLPPFRLVLGLCPALAVTSTAEMGLGMGLAATFVLIFSNMFISMLRKVIPDKVRIGSFIVVIATLVVLGRDGDESLFLFAIPAAWDIYSVDCS